MNIREVSAALDFIRSRREAIDEELAAVRTVRWQLFGPLRCHHC